MYTIVDAVREIKGEKKVQKMVFGTGRLTNDPPKVQTVGKNNSKILRGSKDHRFSIAFNGGGTTKFFPVTAWEKNAENLARLGFKGQIIEIAGRIEEQNYEDKEGKSKSIEILVIEKFDLKSCKDNGDGTANADSNISDSVSPSNESGSTEASDLDGGIPMDGDDDIPF
ncbi:single-stranded DNA-binding protein (plasmid) [Paenibacillus thiaminolyticus]|uniref:single-stranded DNA-binding protein n=1 Tax=Paenibacillus thiaminolyticus TaxID=49283 RepID=UPI00232CA1E2|nr:single-stranded DNA-binding protein [Paenibacillus thiaminolyticus]WCF11443.1 single-stranded DNA-binding protein [Paenibacillus thiaminolyticus]